LTPSCEVLIAFLAMKLELTHLGPVTLVFALAAACGGSPPPVEEAPPPAPPAAAEVPPAPVAAPEPAPASAPAPKVEEPKPPAAAWRVTEGISTPESVYYDAAGDRFFVSNINGNPVEADNNGYITELSGDGKVVKAKLIEGGKDKIKLDAPKGSGLLNGVLYVSDVTVVRKFDVKSGAPKGEIAIKDATFLNDLAIAADGRIFVTDTGVKPGANGFEPTGTDAVYVIDKAGKVKPLAKMKELSGPNGVLVVGKDVLVNTFGSNEIFRLDDKGAKLDVTKVPTGGLDGFQSLGDSLLVSSWAGKTIYKGKLGQKFEPILQGLDGAADFVVDTKRNRVVVPRFMGNAVEAYDVK
jgi:sugar lactone lactonase YvrE